MTGHAVLRHGLSGPQEELCSLHALNACFPHWGGRAMFDWCFTRRGAGRAPGMMSLWVDGRAVAGSAISYRRVAVRGGAEVTAGIMTGSWTLPEARGAGAFTRLIAASREQVASRVTRCCSPLSPPGIRAVIVFDTRAQTSCRHSTVAPRTLWRCHIRISERALFPSV